MSEKLKMKFIDAPVGARFIYPGTCQIWVKLNSYPKGIHYDGRGEIVKWNGNVKGYQERCCFNEEANNFDAEVELVDLSESDRKLEQQIEELKVKLVSFNNKLSRHQDKLPSDLKIELNNIIEKLYL